MRRYSVDLTWKKALVPWISNNYQDTLLIINHNGDFGDGTLIMGKCLLIDGNVGIGTQIPNEKLILQGEHSLAKFRTDEEGRFEIYAESSNVQSLPSDLWLTSQGNIILYPNRFGSSGNVGIGTSDPGEWKLAVNGKIRAKEIKVEADWSDYVFEENYPLMTLKEVENYIKEMGHLNNMPSAAEVKKDGINLGEINAKLLQKIEELTLYTIQQEKKINNLEFQVKGLIKENVK